MSSSHLDRKELKQPDAFVEKTTTIFHFIEKNMKLIGLLLVIAFTAAAGYFLYRNHLTDIEMDAKAKLYPIQKSFTDRVSKITKSEADWVTKGNADIQALEKVASELGKSVAAHDGYMTLGNTFYDRGSFEKAADYFVKAANVANVKSLETAALMQAAYAYENAKKYAQAVLQLNKILEVTETKVFRPEALLALARNYELQGDKARALENYEKFRKEFPNVPSVKNVDAVISKLKTK